MISPSAKSARGMALSYTWGFVGGGFAAGVVDARRFATSSSKVFTRRPHAGQVFKCSAVAAVAGSPVTRASRSSSDGHASSLIGEFLHVLGAHLPDPGEHPRGVHVHRVGGQPQLRRDLRARPPL